MNVRIIKPSIALSQYLEDVVPRSHFYTDVVGNGRHHIISDIYISPCNYSRDPYRDTHFISIVSGFGKVTIKFTSEDCAGVEVRRNGL